VPPELEVEFGDLLRVRVDGSAGSTGAVFGVIFPGVSSGLATLRLIDGDFALVETAWRSSRAVSVEKMEGAKMRLAPSALETDRMHVVTTKHKIRIMGALMNWVLEIDGREAEIPLSTALAPSAVRFDEDGEYTFFVMERFVDGRVPIGFNRYCLVRADLKGRTVYDRSVCEIHKVDMSMKPLPLASGLIWPGPGDPDDDTRAAQFPHARQMILVGCSPSDAVFDYGYVCQKCREAENEWRHEHPQSRQDSNNARTSGSSEPSQSSGR
jgi:hypothetical protein